MRSRITAVAAPLSPWLLPLGALAALAAAACARADASATGDTDAAVPVVVQTMTPSTRAWSTTASGIVQANTSVDVAFQVSGKIVSVGPDEGQTVRAGHEIAAVDPTDYRLALDQASAQADRAARDRDRNRPLLVSGGIAPADMDHLEAAARQGAAAADLAKKRLADTRLAAPITGIVARRAIEVGSSVAPGQPAFTIVDLDPVRVHVGVPEADIGHITENVPASVRIPALDTSFTGHVSLIGVVADPTTRSYTVEISVPNPARRLRAGMVAEATITTGRTRDVLMVPASAVVHDAGVDGTTVVYVVDRDASRVHARRVTTGVGLGDSLEIAAGLSAGDRVVVAGQQRLRDGARIRLANSPAVQPSNARSGAVQP